MRGQADHNVWMRREIEALGRLGGIDVSIRLGKSSVFRLKNDFYISTLFMD